MTRVPFSGFAQTRAERAAAQHPAFGQVPLHAFECPRVALEVVLGEKGQIFVLVPY